MGKFIFELAGFDKKTRKYVKRIGKLRGSHERTKREIASRVERFKKKHDNVLVTGPIDILDEKFFKVIK